MQNLLILYRKYCYIDMYFVSCLAVFELVESLEKSHLREFRVTHILQEPQYNVRNAGNRCNGEFSFKAAGSKLQQLICSSYPEWCFLSLILFERFFFNNALKVCQRLFEGFLSSKYVCRYIHSSYVDKPVFS